MNQQPTNTVLVWDTPFSSKLFPSAMLLVDAWDRVLVVVAPVGIDKYPKYLVRFSAVYAFTSEEEGYSPNIFNSAELEWPTDKDCSFVRDWSPCVKAYDWAVPDIMPFRGGMGPVRHYFIYGGDSVISVVTADPPTVEEITETTALELKFNL